MRKIFQFVLASPLTWLANYLSAAPKKEAVFKSLTGLYDAAVKPGDMSCIILEADAKTDKLVIFSDQHKGNKTWADDFWQAESTYIQALQQYNVQGFTLINLGDSEELWKFKASQILPLNEESLLAEAAFQPERYYKTYGNHDILWKNSLDVNLLLKNYFTLPLPVHEGILLKLNMPGKVLNMFLTHGHQGDVMSDNNRLSTWVVAHIWMPIQRYLRLNINSPSKDYRLRNKHNQMMHEWSSQQQSLLLVTGHTHQPVFASGKYFNHPNNQIPGANAGVKPCYFNTGCCCYSDGDITGIEISDGKIALIKWHSEQNKASRFVLEEAEIDLLWHDLHN